MNKIDSLLKSGKISRIVETEKSRYLDFFSNSYKENLEHSKFNLSNFPRWSIISGYYAMHDITKLFLADKFSIKIEFNVHQTTIEVIQELVKDKEIIKMLNMGFNEFTKLLNDLVNARNKRTNVQYYAGTKFMKEKYQKEAREFIDNTVILYINKIKLLKENAD